MTAIKATKKLNTFLNETLVTSHIQIVLIADIISKITNYAGWSNLKEIFLEIVDILEKLLNINKLLFKEAERSKRSATIIWKGFNRIALLLSQKANKTELFVSKKHFAFVLSKATHENVTITCTDNELKQMEIIVLNSHQEILNSSRVAAVVSLSSFSSEQWFYVTAFSEPSLFVTPSLETVAVESVVLSVNFPYEKKAKNQVITVQLRPKGGFGSNDEVKCANWKQGLIRKTGNLVNFGV
ncbi:uncharacterized protein LOC130655428 [Hydractinia symbiolongicarpus]|uniref:uncharacterized protein LOC130636755 n=1 Tax=Hydractinia symbiolongicarpus TaxID=13093 RepID=UPI00254FABE8|nr:uncharacterized protein LOC130636755 [Hydractinia symbiolongicarpus]XP_057314512.1 uncharacterized protein LOC130655428 [Hydractinia symbiolongicarpus]